MPESCTQLPQTDPAPIADLYRGNYATELLVAAVAHFRVFDHFAGGPVAPASLQQRLNLQDRPFNVLLTALRAMKLIAKTPTGDLALTPVAAEHLIPGHPFYFGDYVALAARRGNVPHMVQRLRTNRPDDTTDAGPGAAFIFRDGIESAMESEASARHLTLGLAGRARNVAPALAQVLDLSKAKHLLDVGGGTGIYSIALLQQNPHLKATVFDRPQVLKIAAEMAERYGVTDRLTLTPGDMFTGTLPPADTILLSNVLHDWDVPECRKLVDRCSTALPSAGQLLIHDVFLNDDLDGPLPIALYSAALFVETEGRAYSAGEYRSWTTSAGLNHVGEHATLVNCGVLVSRKP